MPDFGFIPAALTVHLTSDADFIQTLTAAEPFPDGTVITLLLAATGATPTAWAATVDGSTATFDVDKTQVAALGPDTRLSAELTYSDGAGVDLTWMRGSVRWHG